MELKEDRGRRYHKIINKKELYENNKKIIRIRSKYTNFLFFKWENKSNYKKKKFWEYYRDYCIKYNRPYLSYEDFSIVLKKLKSKIETNIIKNPDGIRFHRMKIRMAFLNRRYGRLKYTPFIEIIPRYKGIGRRIFIMKSFIITLGASMINKMRNSEIDYSLYNIYNRISLRRGYKENKRKYDMFNDFI